MSAFDRLRQRVNRDADGSYRGNNRRLGGLEIAGLLLIVAGLLLWLFRAELGIGAAWSFATGVVGLLLARFGGRHPNTTLNSCRDEPDFARRGYRLAQALLGLVFAGIGLYVTMVGQPGALALAAAALFLVLGTNALLAAWRGRQSWLLMLGPLF